MESNHPPHNVAPEFNWEEPFQEMTQDSYNVTKIFTNKPGYSLQEGGAKRTRGRVWGESDRGRI